MKTLLTILTLSGLISCAADENGTAREQFRWARDVQRAENARAEAFTGTP